MAPYMHQHIEVSSEARKTGGEQTFTVLSHHPGSLQHWAVENVRNSSSSETDRQQNGRKQLRKVLPKPFNSETEALQAVFEAVDDLLFFGSLKHRTTLRFGQPKEPFAAAECSWVDSSGRVHITIKPKQPDIFGPGGRWWVLLSLLLRESCHAYFFLYACQVGSCQVECGMTGHGPAWENVAEWVEYQMKHDWGWILDMRVESSIMLEMTPQAEKLKQQAREYEIELGNLKNWRNRTRNIRNKIQILIQRKRRKNRARKIPKRIRIPIRRKRHKDRIREIRKKIRILIHRKRRLLF
jgi:hypothetical protein